MANRSLDYQVMEYVYDLKNRASEFGFNNLEGWQFSLVSDVEKIKIEKEYYPTMSANPAQEVLLEFLRLVKAKLMLPSSKDGYDFDVNSTAHRDIQHLIAFNPKMHR